MFKKFIQNILYQSEILGEKEHNGKFSIDESLFSTDEENRQIWVIEAIDNITKDFRINVSFNRNVEILKAFLSRYIKTGNSIIADGWMGYSFINSIEGYTREIHIQGAGDFGLGSGSTSHIESI